MRALYADPSYILSFKLSKKSEKILVKNVDLISWQLMFKRSFFNSMKIGITLYAYIHNIYKILSDHILRLSSKHISAYVPQKLSLEKYLKMKQQKLKQCKT